MDLLNINFDAYTPEIIDAFVEVFGASYKDIIVKRFNQPLKIIYNDYDGIKEYLTFLKYCENQKLSLKFLFTINKISNLPSNYSNPLDKLTKNLIKTYLGSSFPFDNHFKKEGIFAFLNPKYKKEQITFINYLRNNHKPLITLNNYEKYRKTKEYLILNKQILTYLNIYNNLEKEYLSYLQDLKKYDIYLKKEKSRLNKILFAKNQKFLSALKKLFSPKIISCLEKSSLDITTKTSIEYFSIKDETLLNSENTKKETIYNIYYHRLNYLKTLGFNIVIPSNLNQIKKLYNTLILNKEIKKVLPKKETCSIITSYRESLLEEAQKEFITTSKTYNTNLNLLSDNITNREILYEIMRDGKICNTGGNIAQKFCPIICYTINSTASGGLDYLYLHEYIHAIESNSLNGSDYISGFDITSSKNHRYNPSKREYELINEIIVDIFALEALTILQNKNIYMAEPQEIIRDVNSWNTDKILKDMLKPLLNNYRDIIISSRLTGNLDLIFNTIGKSNFNKINDYLNIVDYLINNEELVEKLSANYIDKTVKKYYAILSKLEDLYHTLGLNNQIYLLKRTI